METIQSTIAILKPLMAAVKDYVFPQYSDVREDESTAVIRRLVANLAGPQVSEAFVGRLPGIKHLLSTDVEAVEANDPASGGLQEIVYCYPAVTAMLYYRTAHELLDLGVKIVPRMLTEHAHSLTGIDIHPGATIGEYFAIDHGTGVVIGATAVIGRGVTIYQGVTLGARNFRYDAQGRPLDVPRHPILEDGVTVYSNASILGRITIGRGSVIGGNVWLTHSVPAGSRVLQGKTQEHFSDGAGI